MRIHNIAIGWIVSLIIIACSSVSTPNNTAIADAGDEAEGEVDAGSDASDGGVGYTMDGIYRCCLEGAGRSCCADAGDTPTRTKCFPFVRCTKEGDGLDRHFICSSCCDGMKYVDPLEPVNDAGSIVCEPTSTPGSKICVRCGDGVCGKGENVCNCPEDCKADGG